MTNTNDNERFAPTPANLDDIPERERWLYRNPEALQAVRKGLAEAARGEVEELDLSEYQHLLLEDDED